MKKLLLLFALIGCVTWSNAKGQRVKYNFNSDSLYDENVINTMAENYFEVTYFVPDEHKEGGSYEHVTGYLKKLDSIGHLMIVVDDNGTETVIDTRRIYDIDL